MLDVAAQFQGHNDARHDAVIGSVEKSGVEPFAEKSVGSYAKALKAGMLTAQRGPCADRRRADSRQPEIRMERRSPSMRRWKPHGYWASGMPPRGSPFHAASSHAAIRTTRVASVAAASRTIGTQQVHPAGSAPMRFAEPKIALLAVALFAAVCTARAQDSTAGDWIRNPAMGNYKAYAEFKMAHYDAARHIWETLAGLGNPDALFNLGILAEDGLGEPKDIQKAEALYVAAANAGGFKAQYRLGMLYSTGGAVAKDVAKARQYLSLASANGDKEAAARLASLDQPDRPLSEFEQAELLASSGQHAQAAALYQRTADAGNITARTRLAWMYEAGRGRPKDREQSMIWLRRAAGQKYPAAVAALAAETEAN